MFRKLRHYLSISILLTLPVFFVGTVLVAYLLEFLGLKSHNAYFPASTYLPAIGIAFSTAGLITLRFFPYKNHS